MRKNLLGLLSIIVLIIGLCFLPKMEASAESIMTSPFYHLSKIKGGEFYTTDLGEKNEMIQNHGYADMGVACYIVGPETDQPSATIPLFRLKFTGNYEGTNFSEYLYTTSQNEVDDCVNKYGWSFDGTAGYVIDKNNSSADTVLMYRWYCPSAYHWHGCSTDLYDPWITKLHQGTVYEGVLCRVWTNYCSVEVSDSRLDSPYGLKAFNSGEEVRLTWRSPSNDEDYISIERKTSDSSFHEIATVEGEITSYNDDSVSADTSYTYRVRAWRDGQSSSPSNEAQVYIENDVNDFKDDHETILLDFLEDDFWDDHKEVLKEFLESDFWDQDHEEILKDFIEYDFWDDHEEILDEILDNDFWDDHGGILDEILDNDFWDDHEEILDDILNNDFGDDHDGILDDLIGEGSYDLRATVISSSEINLTWDSRPIPPLGYRVERRSNNGSYITVANVHFGTRSFTDSGLDQYTRYYYRVRAYNLFGDLDYSDEISVCTSSYYNGSEDEWSADEYYDENQSLVIKLRINSKNFYVNGTIKIMDTMPVIIEGRTLVPIRFLAESIGANIIWNDYEKKATISHDGEKIELWVGRNTAQVNGSRVHLDDSNAELTPIINNNRVMLPLRFVSEQLGFDVEWNDKLKEIILTY